MLSNRKKTIIISMIGFALANNNDPRQLNLKFDTEEDQQWFYDAIFAVEQDYTQYQIEQEQAQYEEIYY